MRILDRYLLNGFFHALLYCLALFFVLFVVIDVFNNLDEFLKNSVSLDIILRYYAYSLPGISYQFFLFSFLGFVRVFFLCVGVFFFCEISCLRAREKLER